MDIKPTRLSAGLFLGAVLSSQCAFASLHDWSIRVRAIDIIPDASSSYISLISGTVDHISTRLAPELDVSYFFSPCLAAELALTAGRFHLVADGTILSNDSVDYGKAMLFPPTLTLQYHFLIGSCWKPYFGMINSSLKPYFGAGINYTHFYNVDSAPEINSISYENSFGPVLQVGIDFFSFHGAFINIDVKKVFIRTDVAAEVPDEAGAIVSTRVYFDPMIYGIGIGYRF